MESNVKPLSVEEAVAATENADEITVQFAVAFINAQLRTETVRGRTVDVNFGRVANPHEVFEGVKNVFEAPELDLGWSVEYELDLGSWHVLLHQKRHVK